MKKNRKIFVFDNVIIGSNHLVYNSGCINMVQRIFSQQTNVFVFGEKGHLAAIKPLVENFGTNSIYYNQISVTSPGLSLLSKIIHWPLKLLNDRNNYNSLFKKSREERPDLILFTTVTSVNLYLFLSLFRKNPEQKILVGLHGEIEYLFRKDLTIKQKTIAKWYRRIFANVPSNVKFFALSPFIRSQIIEEQILTKEQILFIEHPISNIQKTKDPSSGFSPTIFSHLGVATFRKGSHNIFKLAEAFCEQVQSTNIIFRIIGRLDDEIRSYQNQFVNVTSVNGQQLDQDKYEELILSSAYSLSFLPEDEYLYRISGSIMDSIQYCLPIISTDHRYISHLFSEAGDIGFICKNDMELKTVIREILSGNRIYLDKYSEQVNNLRAYSSKFESSSNALVLREQLLNIGWTFITNN
jgi:hypothetical protein